MHAEHPEVEQVWIYDKVKLKNTPNYIKQVKRHSLEMMKELATAKVWVDSHYQPCWVFKRKSGQFFIQTWHGGLGFKKIGLDAAQKKISIVELARLKCTAKKVDLWVTDSDWSIKVHKTANNYKGKFLKCGLPKTDFLIGDEKNARERVHEFYKLDKSKKIVLYAPTMRKDPRKDDFEIDVKQVLEALEERFGGDFKFIVRLHPVNQDVQKRITMEHDEVYDGLKYGDMQDMIAAADVYISDYSSAIFDSAILKHPVFCFAFDEDRYDEKERGFYQKPEDLPFPVAHTNEELCEAILGFNKEKYEKDPNLKVDKDKAKKVKQKVLADARARTNAKKALINIEPNEWKAIQARAVSSTTLRKILNNTDMDKLKELATPRDTVSISNSTKAKLKAMKATGYYTIADMAEMTGISTSTVSKYLSGKA